MKLRLNLRRFPALRLMPSWCRAVNEMSTTQSGAVSTPCREGVEKSLLNPFLMPTQKESLHYMKLSTDTMNEVLKQMNDAFAPGMEVNSYMQLYFLHSHIPSSPQGAYRHKIWYAPRAK